MIRAGEPPARELLDGLDVTQRIDHVPLRRRLINANANANARAPRDDDRPAIATAAAATYFAHLNYTLGNEDTSVELAALPERVGHVLSVAGGGGRVLPLLARAPRRLTCVDVSREQLLFTELRLASARALERDAFLAFWGYPPREADPRERRALFDRLRLGEDARAFASTLFTARAWGPLLYAGRWERTFATLARANRAITGARALGLFEARTADEARAYLRTRFPRRRWHLVLRALGNATVFDALLYGGQLPRKNLDESHARFYRAAFDRALTLGPPRESFFLEICFFGRVVHEEACPIECDPDVFARAKAALADTEIVYRRGDVRSVARDVAPIDFVSMSDVPSYWPARDDRAWLQALRPALADGARVVARAYLRVPRDVDTRGYDVETGDFRDVIAREKVQVYAIEIYRRRGDGEGG